MGKLKEKLEVIIILFPIFLFFGIGALIHYPFELRRIKKFKKQLNPFLKEINNKSFFIYNNKKLLLPLIQKDILPKLNSDIEIIFVEGRKINTDYEVKFISHILYDLKNYKKFPHLIKIRNGKVIDMSINDRNHSIRNKPKNELMNEIHSFFEIKT